MYKLGLIFIILAYCNAKTVKKDLKETDISFGAKIKEPHKKVCLSDISKDPLWVLDLNDDELNFKQLRSPNKMDRRVFREVMEPAIKNYKYQQLSKGDFDKTTTTPPEIDSETEEITQYDLKKQIFRMFNKFIMPYKAEPCLHFHLDDNNKVSTKLYFKGPFTSLVIRYKNKRWNYFLSPPSSLPRWFYEKHTKVTRSGQAMYVTIPDAVRNEFYGKLFYMLRDFFSFVM